LKQLGVESCYGLSTQDSDYQEEVRNRLHLPYDLLSDNQLEFQSALKLPTFEWQGKKVIRRMCFAIEGGEIVHCWYPIFPPDANVQEVIAWLKERQ
jgi:peroxiredoxin